MPLIYSAVARGPTILAEYAVFAGNFSAVTKDYLSKANNSGRFSYTVDSHVFSFLGEDGYSTCLLPDAPCTCSNSSNASRLTSHAWAQTMWW
jgi:hypothetical protein